MLRTPNSVSTKRGNFEPNFSELNFGFNANTSLSQLQQNKVQQPLDFWIDTSSAHFQQKLNQAYNSGEFGVVYMGADYVINNRLVGGILGEVDAISERNNYTNALNSYYKARGTGWMVGPYLSGRLLPNLYFYSRASWGQSQNSINVFWNTKDDFSTQRQMYVAELSGWYQLKKLNIVPTLGARYFDELQNQFTNFANFYIPSQTVKLGQLNAGPEFNYPLSINDRFSSTLNFSIQSIYNFKNSGLTFPATPNASLFGRLNIGSEIIYRNRLTITPLLLWDGIGSHSYNALGGRLQMSYRDD